MVVFGVQYAEPPLAGCWSWMPYQHEKAKTERGNESESAQEPEGDSPRDGADSAVAPPAGSVGPGLGVQSDPLGGPTAGVPAEERAPAQTAVVPGATGREPQFTGEPPEVVATGDVETSAGEPLKPARKPRKSSKK
ncbi:MAG: hypothetical protein V3T71_02460, partial [Dehalococcoidia bacterium]